MMFPVMVALSFKVWLELSFCKKIWRDGMMSVPAVINHFLSNFSTCLEPFNFIMHSFAITSCCVAQFLTSLA